MTRSNPQAPGGGGCPAGGYTGSNAVSLPNDTVPADGQCYQYTLTGTDRVGNTSTYRTNVLVDTTGPAGGSVSYADGLSSLSAISVDWDSGTDGRVRNRAGARRPRDRVAERLDLRQLRQLHHDRRERSRQPDRRLERLRRQLLRVPDRRHEQRRRLVDLLVGLRHEADERVADPARSGEPGGRLPAAARRSSSARPPRTCPGSSQLTTVGQNGVTQATWQGKSSGPITSAPAADSTPTNPPFDSGVYTWDGSAVTDTIQLTRDPGATVDIAQRRRPTSTTRRARSTTRTARTRAIPSTSRRRRATASPASAARRCERSEAPLTGATCGAWSSFAPVTLNGGGNDTTVADNTCYRYQLVVTDNVGNTLHGRFRRASRRSRTSRRRRS